MIPWVDIHSHQAPQKDTLRIHSLSYPFLLTQVYFSVAIHPWWGKQKASLGEVTSLWKRRNCLLMGEMGLDKRSVIPFDLQKELFEKQLTEAYSFSKPILIHCVRAYEECFKLIKQYPKTFFIFHDYNGSLEFTKKCLKHSDYLYFSYGKSLFRSQSKGLDSLSTLPPQRLFLETDESTFSIQEIYAQASKLLGQDILSLKQQIYLNFHSVFKL